MQMTNFDATNIPPQQMSGKHPTGTFPFQISNTYAAPTKDNKGGKFVVEFKTPVGTIPNYYNLWNENEKAVEIAQKELSALCHATGVYKLSMSAENLAMCGHELRGAQGVVIVRDQPNNPQYSEVEKVLDRNGNEPGKGSVTPQPQQGGAWGGTQAPPNNTPPNNAGGGNSSWGQPAAQPTPPANQGGWSPGPQQQGGAPQGDTSKPPWQR